MRAALDDAAMFQHHDAVGVLDGREAVCNHERGAARHEAVHALLHQRFGERVDRACRLVENQHGRIGHSRAGDGEQLPLALREVCTVAREHRYDIRLSTKNAGGRQGSTAFSGRLRIAAQGADSPAKPAFPHGGKAAVFVPAKHRAAQRGGRKGPGLQTAEGRADFQEKNGAQAGAKMSCPPERETRGSAG